MYYCGFFVCGYYYYWELWVQGVYVYECVEVLCIWYVEVYQDQVGIGVLVGEQVQCFYVVCFVQLYVGNYVLYGFVKGFVE